MTETCLAFMCALASDLFYFTVDYMFLDYNKKEYFHN